MMQHSPQAGANIVKSQAWDGTRSFLSQNRTELIKEFPHKA